MSLTMFLWLQWYYSDAAPVYNGLLYYTGIQHSMIDKGQTYSVEGDNAEPRHYLARLARKSRCVEVLHAAVRLFTFCRNQRQLYRRLYPDNPAHRIDFISIRS